MKLKAAKQNKSAPLRRLSGLVAAALVGSVSSGQSLAAALLSPSELNLR
jgi:hypothetical protein